MRKTKTTAVDLTKLDGIAQRIDAHDLQVRDAIASLRRIDERMSGLTRELGGLRGQANKATASGDFPAADGIARDIAAKVASLDASESARADIAKQLGRLIDAGAELEREGEAAFQEVVMGAYTGMLEELKRDLPERLAAVWSAAVAGGIELPFKSWVNGALSDTFSSVRLVTADRAVPGAPRSWPRCSSLDAARELVADTETEQAA